jgi:hypothetical protein
LSFVISANSAEISECAILFFGYIRELKLLIVLFSDVTNLLLCDLFTLLSWMRYFDKDNLYCIRRVFERGNRVILTVDRKRNNIYMFTFVISIGISTIYLHEGGDRLKRDFNQF